MKKFRDIVTFIEMITDLMVLFGAYVLSVYIRYYVMESDPGLPVLSLPYLLVAFIYCFIMACIFLVVLSQDKRKLGCEGEYRLSNKNLFRILYINLIGCLALMSFFYVAGIMYFSRWALILFWCISGAMVIIKRGLLEYCVWEKKKKEINTIVVGDGKFAEQYMIAAYSGRQNHNIIGYVRVDMERDPAHQFSILECRSGEVNTHMISCLADLDELDSALRNHAINEVVIAVDSPAEINLENVVNTIKKHKLDIGMVSGFGTSIPKNASVYEVGNSKVLDMNKKPLASNNYSCFLGLIFSYSILAILLIFNLYGIGNLQEFQEYDSYKCIILGISGVFLFGLLIQILHQTSYKYIKSAVISILASALISVIFEILYVESVRIAGRFILSDLKVITIAILFCMCVSGLYRMLDDQYF